MRLLVVEDDPDLNRQLTTALTDAGYVVDRAYDGEEGLEKVQANPPDAIVLDVMMPDGTEGFQFVWKLRNEFPPELADTHYGEEMWALYEKGDLLADSALTCA